MMLTQKCNKQGGMKMLNKNKLLGRMAEQGYTQKMLADELGIGTNTMNSKINGKSSFTLEQADCICAILGITEACDKGEIFFA